VPDPYRWLEDDNSLDTKAWVEAQNKATSSFLEQIPEREQIKTRLTRLWNYEKFSTPSKNGNRYFYSHNSGLQSQSVLYVTEDPKQAGRVLLDPNTLSKDGTVALSGSSLTDDGRLMAYSVSVAGSDWQVWKVRDIDTGKDLSDEIHWSKASGASWMKDNSGFFYSRFAAPKADDAFKGINQIHQVYFHKLGTPQSVDRLIFERKDQPEWYLSAVVSEDGHWLVITAGKGTDPKSSVFIKDLSRPDSPIEPLPGTVLEEIFCPLLNLAPIDHIDPIDFAEVVRKSKLAANKFPGFRVSPSPAPGSVAPSRGSPVDDVMPRRKRLRVVLTCFQGQSLIPSF